MRIRELFTEASPALHSKLIAGDPVGKMAVKYALSTTGQTPYLHTSDLKKAKEVSKANPATIVKGSNKWLVITPDRDEHSWSTETYAIVTVFTEAGKEIAYMKSYNDLTLQKLEYYAGAPVQIFALPKPKIPRSPLGKYKRDRVSYGVPFSNEKGSGMRQSFSNLIRRIVMSELELLRRKAEMADRDAFVRVLTNAMKDKYKIEKFVKVAYNWILNTHPEYGGATKYRNVFKGYYGDWNFSVPRNVQTMILKDIRKVIRDYLIKHGFWSFISDKWYKP